MHIFIITCVAKRQVDTKADVAVSTLAYACETLDVAMAMAESDFKEGFPPADGWDSHHLKSFMIERQLIDAVVASQADSKGSN